MDWLISARPVRRFLRHDPLPFISGRLNSPFTTWIQIVYDWLDALKDPNGVKTLYKHQPWASLMKRRWPKNSAMSFCWKK
nr:terminase [Salmonella sp. NCTC 7297]